MGDIYKNTIIITASNYLNLNLINLDKFSAIMKINWYYQTYSLLKILYYNIDKYWVHHVS